MAVVMECQILLYGLICQELERADSGTRSFASVQGSLSGCIPFTHMELRTKTLASIISEN